MQMAGRAIGKGGYNKHNFCSSRILRQTPHSKREKKTKRKVDKTQNKNVKKNPTRNKVTNYSGMVS